MTFATSIMVTPMVLLSVGLFVFFQLDLRAGTMSFLSVSIAPNTMTYVLLKTEYINT